jgi:dihydrofolate synthase/folylpolyglutamate synthase
VHGVHGDYHGLSLVAPAYQGANIATAIAATEAALGRALDSVRTQRALDTLTLPGRFELVRTDPPVIVDGSHNPQAAEYLARAIVDAWPDPRRRPLVVLGVLADKDADGIVRALAPHVAGFVVTAPLSPRARDAGSLAQIARAVLGRDVRAVEPLGAALQHAIREGVYGVVATGSLTVAGQARRAVLDASATPQAAPERQDGSFC